MSTEPQRSATRELGQLAVSSAITTGTEYASYILLVELAGVHYLAAGSSTSAIGIVVNFTLNKLWVFRRIPGSTSRQALRHVLATCFGIALGAGILYLLVDGLAIPYSIARVIQCAGVFLAYTFPVNRYFVFPRLPRRRRPAVG